MKIKVKTEGLEGDALKFAVNLNEYLETMPESATKQDITDALDAFKTANTPAVETAEAKTARETSEANAKKELNELKETVQQLKESSGGSLKVEGAFLEAIEKGLTNILPQLKEMKAQADGTKGKELVIEVKAAVNMTTGAVANFGGVTTPDAIVYQQGLSFAEDVRKKEYIINYLSNGNTDKASLPYMDKVPTEGTMTVTAEGALKPLLSISFVLRYSTATKIAGRTKVSEEALDDIPFLLSIIQNELKYQHDIAEQEAIFAKVAAIAPGFVAGSMAASTTAPSNWDAVRAAIYGVKIASKGMFIPNAVLIPSANAYAMGATKDLNNNYVLPAWVMPDGTKISGVQIIEVADGTTVADGTFIVGDWKKLHRLVYKSFTLRIGQGIQGSATAANIQSDFETNMYTIIGESREHLWIYENEKSAFLKTTFAAVKTAIAV